ncbi:hypothetical protein C8R45DRAFT_922674 [Mycena sanguinolenta]|nr:hypothetical protein C8R45DRAFT_922674 [Mycena sanguinolenta]
MTGTVVAIAVTGHAPCTLSEGVSRVIHHTRLSRESILYQLGSLGRDAVQQVLALSLQGVEVLLLAIAFDPDVRVGDPVPQRQTVRVCRDGMRRQAHEKLVDRLVELAGIGARDVRVQLVA